ncbi:hypothetical protein Ancab_035452 [Ancistrocladus abbreviatus]
MGRRNSRGAAEFSGSIFNFLKDQDVRFKLRDEICDKVPYFLIRENNWTFNADMMGRWNLRYDLLKKRHSFHLLFGAKVVVSSPKKHIVSSTLMYLPSSIQIH